MCSASDTATAATASGGGSSGPQFMGITEPDGGGFLEE